MSVTSGRNCIFQHLEEGECGRNIEIQYPFWLDWVYLCGLGVSRGREEGCRKKEKR